MIKKGKTEVFFLSVLIIQNNLDCERTVTVSITVGVHNDVKRKKCTAHAPPFSRAFLPFSCILRHFSCI